MHSDDEPETLEYVAEILEAIGDAIGVNAEVTVKMVNGMIAGEFVGNDAGTVIGHHGETIDAIQHLAYRIAFQGVEERTPLTVDAAGYRDTRAAALHAIADQAAETAIREGRAVALDPMAAHERKIVHEYLKPRFEVETYSEGQEPARRLVVAPLEH